MKTAPKTSLITVILTASITKVSGNIKDFREDTLKIAHKSAPKL